MLCYCYNEDWRKSLPRISEIDLILNRLRNMIEKIRSNIDATNFNTILNYIDDPETEIDYAIVILGGDLAETVLVALNGNADIWMNMMTSGQIKIIIGIDKEIRPEAAQYSYDRNQIPKDECVDCLYVPPGYFIKRRRR